MKTAYAKSKCPASQIRAGWSVYNAIHSGPSHGPTPAIRSVVGFVDGSCKSQDMIGSDTFSLTQEFLSHMLGVRRNAVEAHAVQQAGLIRYRRGHIIVFSLSVHRLRCGTRVDVRFRSTSDFQLFSVLPAALCQEQSCPTFALSQNTCDSGSIT
jgi:hypothetical protein